MTNLKKTKIAIETLDAANLKTNARTVLEIAKSLMPSEGEPGKVARIKVSAALEMIERLISDDFRMIGNEDFVDYDEYTGESRICEKLYDMMT